MVTEKMSINTRKEYLKKVKKRYLKADKKEKGTMLSEFVKNTGYNEKYAIRVLSPRHSYVINALTGKRITPIRMKIFTGSKKSGKSWIIPADKEWRR